MGDGQNPTSGPALGVVEPQASRVAARAQHGPMLGLDCDAAVFPRLPLKLAADGERAAVEVNVVPLECQGLALAEPQRERDRPPGSVAVVGRDCQQAVHLLNGEWLDFRVQHARDGGIPARIGGDESAAYGDGEGGAEGAVQVAGRGGTNADRHTVEQVIDLAHGYLVQLDVSQLLAVGADQGLVCGERLGFAASLDVHKPFVEPVPEGLPTIRCREPRTVCTLVLHGRHALGHGALGTTPHVPAYQPAVLVAAHGDPSVPGPCGVPVDRGPAVSGSGPAHEAT
ncbi:hypothetical protein BJM39_23400 [Salmonella enterica subsp. enterica serovar Javiana]|nr:hypothetical protein BJM39_23400 [Salmonella enterica subsp. enterica serovar Javiana]